MKEYFFLIRGDGSMVWKNSGHGPAVYHDIRQVKRHGRQHAKWNGNTRILHMWFDKGTAQTQWLNWSEIDEY